MPQGAAGKEDALFFVLRKREAFDAFGFAFVVFSRKKKRFFQRVVGEI